MVRGHLITAPEPVPVADDLVPILDHRSDEARIPTQPILDTDDAIDPFKE